jgi:hypothetical protein
MASGRRMPRASPSVYAWLMLASLLMWRWPAFLVATEFSADESQFVAGAITLGDDPVFWRSVDGQTVGPLGYYALLPLALFGPPNFFGARLIVCLLVFGALWFSYRGIRAVWGDAMARCIVLPGFCFFALTNRFGFIFYTSEYVSLLILAIGQASLLVAMAEKQDAVTRGGEWLIAGLALGAIPFVKLQPVLPAAVLLLAALVWVAAQRGWTPGIRRRTAVILLAGVCVVPALFAAMLSIGGAWEVFWLSYIKQNLAYTTDGWNGLRTAVAIAWPHLRQGGGMFVFVIVVSVCAMPLLAASHGRPTSFDRVPVRLMLIYALTWIPVCFATRPYRHYLVYLVLPFTLLAGVALARRWNISRSGDGFFAHQRGLAIFWFALLVVPQIAHKAISGDPYWAKIDAGRITPEPEPIAREVLRRAHKGDRLSVWGYQPKFHVQTGLPQGTHECNSYYQITPGPHREYHRRRYLEELERRRPRFRVDATGYLGNPARAARPSLAQQGYSDLREYVAANYDLVMEDNYTWLFVRRQGSSGATTPARLEAR